MKLLLSLLVLLLTLGCERTPEANKCSSDQECGSTSRCVEGTCVSAPLTGVDRINQMLHVLADIEHSHEGNCPRIEREFAAYLEAHEEEIQSLRATLSDEKMTEAQNDRLELGIQAIGESRCAPARLLAAELLLSVSQP